MFTYGLVNLEQSEKILIAIALNKIISLNLDKKTNNIEIGQRTVKITIREIMESLNICLSEKEATYKKFKRALFSLYTKTIEYTDKKKYEITSNWIEYSMYKELEYVQFTFTEDAFKYLIKNKKLTPYMGLALKLKTKKAIKMFDFIITNKKTCEMIIQRDDFISHFNVPESAQKHGNLERRIINPLINEINEIINLDLTYEPLNKQKKMTTIFKFHFSDENLNSSI